MSKLDSFLPAEGVVQKVNKGLFEVEATLGTRKQLVTCRRGGRLKTVRLALLPGDRVTILVSAADLTKGLIDRRIDARHE